MANEWVLIEKLSEPIDFTVADGAGIEKGTLMALSSPRTAVANTVSGAVLVGILAREKIANDGRTRSAVFLRGVFKMRASGAVVLGQAVQGGGLPGNLVTSPPTSGVKGSRILGIALETIADNAEGHILVNIGAGGQ